MLSSIKNTQRASNTDVPTTASSSWRSTLDYVVSSSAKPEWDGEEVKEHELSMDDFTYSVVLAMESSVELTSMGYYLHRAIQSGIHKRFVSINGGDIALKVKKYLSSTWKSRGQETPTEDQDFWEKTDVWAEAIKHQLIQIKRDRREENGHQREIYMRGFQLKNRPTNLASWALRSNFIQEDPLKGHPTGGWIHEPPPVPPSTQSKALRDRERIPRHDLYNNSDNLKKKSKSKRDRNNQQYQKNLRYLTFLSTMGDDSPCNSKPRSTKMRKRGELPIPPMTTTMENPPANGNQTYVILQGFYNPEIIGELIKIGVRVDAVLVMTDENGKNCFEIPETEGVNLRHSPKLQDYLKNLEQHNSMHQHRDVVGQFWSSLVELLQKPATERDPNLANCSLMNCILPNNELGLDTPEARGVYASQVFQVASQSIYEIPVITSNPDTATAEEEECNELLNESNKILEEAVKNSELQEYLEFTDESITAKVETPCPESEADAKEEAIKLLENLSEPDYSVEELLKILCDHYHLIKGYISKILKERIMSGDHKNVDTTVALRESTSKIEVSVVKKDLFEYIQKGQGDAGEDFCKSSAGRPPSSPSAGQKLVLLMDPLPTQDPRKYVTFMEPVSELNLTQQTMCTIFYREPVLQLPNPASATLNPPKHEGHRWFSYVLNEANRKRPKFIRSAREEYVKKKRAGELKPLLSKKREDKSTSIIIVDEEGLQRITSDEEAFYGHKSSMDEKKKMSRPHSFSHMKKDDFKVKHERSATQGKTRQLLK